MSMLRFFTGGICHQFPSHALVYDGQALPLCARCSGSFLGICIALISLWLAGEGRASRMPSRRIGLPLAAMIGVWAFDGTNSAAQWLLGRTWLYPANNVLRLATGMCMGLALGVLLYPILQYTLWYEVSESPVLAQPRRFIAPLLLGAATVTLLLSWRSAPYLLWLIIVSAAVLSVLVIVNALLIALLCHASGVAERRAGIWPYAVAGFLASLFETGTIAVLRRYLMV